MTPAVDPQLWWYVARAAGIVSWGMLTAGVLWGAVLASDLFPASRRPAWLLATHRWLGALSLWFLAIHLLGLVADSYVSFGLADLVVPLASDWKPVPVAAGVLALWTLVAVELTSLTIRTGRRRLWRAVHLTSYAAFALASLHGTFAGSDAANPVYALSSIAATGAVVAAVCYRIVRRGPGRHRSPLTSGAQVRGAIPPMDSHGRSAHHRAVRPRSGAVTGGAGRPDPG